MKNAILIAILVLALSSCYTKWQCYDLVYRTDTISNTYRKDSINTTTINKDTSIGINLPVIRVDKILFIKDKTINTISSNFATSTIEIKGDSILHTIEDKDTTINVLLRQTTILKNYYKELYINERISNNVVKKELSFFERLQNLFLNYVKNIINFSIFVIIIFLELKFKLFTSFLTLLINFIKHGNITSNKL